MKHNKLDDPRIQRALGFRVQPTIEHAAVRHQTIAFVAKRAPLWSPSIAQVGYLGLICAIVFAIVRFYM